MGCPTSGNRYQSPRSHDCPPSGKRHPAMENAQTAPLSARRHDLEGIWSTEADNRLMLERTKIDNAFTKPRNAIILSNLTIYNYYPFTKSWTNGASNQWKPTGFGATVRRPIIPAWRAFRGLRHNLLRLGPKFFIRPCVPPAVHIYVKL